MECIINFVQSPSDATLQKLHTYFLSGFGLELEVTNLLKIEKIRDVLGASLLLVLKNGGFILEGSCFFNRKNYAIRQIVDLLHSVGTNGGSTDPNFMTDVFCNLGILLDGKYMGADIGEDTKSSIIRLFEVLLLSAEHTFNKQLYETESGIKTLALLFHSLLSVSKEERSKTLKLEALVLTYKLLAIVVHDDTKKSSILSEFLPGILKSCMEISLEENTFKIVCQALKNISSLLRCTLDDENFITTETKEDFSFSNRTDLRTRNKVIYPSPEWLSFTQPRLEVVMNRLAKLRSSESNKVRMELLNVAGICLLSCKRSMSNCLPSLLGIVVGSLVDEHEQIQEIAKDILDKRKSATDAELDDAVYERLFHVSSDALRTVRLGSSREQAADLLRLQGYLKLLESRPLDVTVIRHLLKTFLQMAELEGSSVHQYSRGYPVGFRYLLDEQIINEFRKACAFLGRRDHFLATMDLLKAYLQDAMVSKGSALLVLLFTLDGLDMHDSVTEAESDCGRDLVEECLTELKKSSGAALFSVRDLNLGALKECIYLEILGSLSRALGSSFGPHLVKVLYPVVAASGRGDSRTPLSEAVASSARRTLEVFAEGNVPEFLSRNIDYITAQVCIAMTDESELVNVSKAVRAVGRLGSSVSISCANASAKTAIRLLKSKGTRYSRLLLLFQAYGESVTASLTSSPLNLHPQPKEARPVRGLLQKIILEHEERLERSENFEDDPEDLQEEPPQDEGFGDVLPDEDEKKTVPEHVTICADIVSICRNYLNSRDEELVCLAFDALGSALTVLRNHDDALLPVIHSLWSLVLSKSKHDNARLRVSAISLLRRMVDVSGDFLRVRIVKEILPRLVGIVAAAGNKRLERFSQDHKLLSETLVCLTTFLEKLDVRTKERHDILVVCGKLLLKDPDTDIKVLVTGLFRVCTSDTHLADHAWLVLDHLEQSSPNRISDIQEFKLLL